MGGNAFVPNNPDLPLIVAYIGGKKFSNQPPRNLKSLEVEQISGNRANRYVLSIFDEDWVEVEAALFQAKWEMAIQFGWASSGVFSPTYKIEVMNVHPIFEPQGVTLEITGVSKGILSIKASKRTEAHEGKPDEVIRKLAQRCGYEVECPVFKEFQENLNLEDTTPKPKVWRQNNQDDLEFLVNDVLPFCETPDGKTGFSAHIDDVKKKIIIENPNFEQGAIRTYTFARDPHGVVKSFEVETANLRGVYRDGGGPAESGGGSQSIFTDINSGKDDIQEVTGTDSEVKKNKSGQKTVGHEPQEGLNSMFMGYQFLTKAQQETFHKNIFNTVNDFMFKATLEVIGDPRNDLTVGKVIKVFTFLGGIHRPSNTPHYTSGDYRIFGIRHSISPGSFTTTFELHRSAQKQGTKPAQ